MDSQSPSILPAAEPGAPPSAGALAALRRFARPRAPRERCDLCAADIGEPHRHLFAPADRNLVCACDACAILFSDTQGGRFRLVPRQGKFWPDFHMDDAEWQAMNVPINLAFFTFSSTAGKVIAYYPSPAGATESEVLADAWQVLQRDNPRLANMKPDVEALLVNRIGPAGDYFLAPIDECYKLVGLVRSNWRGLSGGADVWRAIAEFFKELREKSARE